MYVASFSALYMYWLLKLNDDLVSRVLLMFLFYSGREGKRFAEGHRYYKQREVQDLNPSSVIPEALLAVAKQYCLYGWTFVLKYKIVVHHLESVVPKINLLCQDKKG